MVGNSDHDIGKHEQQFFIYFLYLFLFSYFLNFQFFFRFDANAPYTASAIGITTQVTRRPPNEWTLRNKNLANLYAGKYINASYGHVVRDFESEAKSR